MATLRMALAAPFLNKVNAAKLQATPTNFQKGDVMGRLSELMVSIAGGLRQRAPGQAHPSLILSIDDNATAATGTVTCVTVANNSTVKVGNVTLTGVTGTPSGQAQWKCGVSAAADGIALRQCVNAHTTLSKYFLATDNGSGVVTITCILSALGAIGNLMALTSSDGTNLAVVGFASGADDPGAQTYSF